MIRISIFQITNISSRILALVTGVSNTFMLCFFVLCQLRKLSCRILAFVTGISYTFMFRCFVMFEIAWNKSWILALITGVSDTFMFRLFMPFKIITISGRILTQYPQEEMEEKIKLGAIAPRLIFSWIAIFSCGYFYYYTLLKFWANSRWFYGDSYTQNEKL